MKRASRALYKEIGNGVYLSSLQPYYKTKTLSRDHGRGGHRSAQYGRMLFMCAASKEVGTSSCENGNHQTNRQDEESADGKQAANHSTAAVDSLGSLGFYAHLARLNCTAPASAKRLIADQLDCGPDTYGLRIES
jgi:hypothetical protein